jgi:hypothetical protein
MASHGGPMLHTLEVIEHNPRILQISTGLHLFDQVHPRSGPHLRHLENKPLLRSPSPIPGTYSPERRPSGYSL